MTQIPHEAKKLPDRINIENIVFSDNTISWDVPETRNKITLTKSPLCLKFENNENIVNLKRIIKEHFDEMKPLVQSGNIHKDAYEKLRDSICIDGKIDGEYKVTKNNTMSLLHFFGTWLGPTDNIHAKGHAIMNNLHYQLFGFHQYHGKQYRPINRDDWTNLRENCGDNCSHETCLKHAKNEPTFRIIFYKTGSEVFSAYSNYMNYFLQTGKVS